MRRDREMSDQEVDEGFGEMGPETASLVLAFTLCGIDPGDEADSEALNELMMRHYPPGAVMEAQMVIMMSSLGAGLGAIMEEGLTGASESDVGAEIMGGLEQAALEALRGADRETCLKAVALGRKVALLDGVVDDREQEILDRLLDHFGLTIGEVDTYIDGFMQVTEAPRLDELTDEEATFLFATMMAGCEDREPDPSSPEGRVISEVFDMQTAFGLMAKLPKERPAEMPEGKDPVTAYFAPKVLPALKKADDDKRLRALAIGLRVANADGRMTSEEEETLARFCKGLGHDLESARAWSSKEQAS